MDKDASASQPPQEMPAVVTTIVGGRPPGCGKQLGQIPRGIEVLVKKASVDPAFRARLLAARSGAAHEIGLSLEPAEAMMLDLVPATQLDAIIAQTKVEPSKQPLFLGKAAAVMLAALGASAIIAPAQVQATKGVRYDGPRVTAPAQPTTQSTQPCTASAPATTVPTTTPAAVRNQIPPILKQLDSETFKVREEAQQKLQALGLDALDPLREVLRKGEVGLEVVSRIRSAMWSIKATTRPTLLNPPPLPDPMPMVIAGLMVRKSPQPPEKPED